MEPLFGPEDLLRPGAVAGDYVVRAMLGAGGCASVYESTQWRTGEPAALKVLHARLASSPKMIARFAREVEAIRKVRHPGIVTVHAFGRLAGGRPFYAMDLLEGQTLSALARAHGRLSPREALEVMDPLCDVLHAVHEAGIVHRDLKASNVFVTRGGDRPGIKILDFGIAKLLRPEPEGGALTTAGRKLGTPSAMAPEQILGLAVDHRADVYALGILLFRLLTGRAPFVGETLLEIEAGHLGTPPSRPSRMAPIACAIDAVVLRCLEKQPQDRYSTVLDFAEDLRRAVGANRPRAVTPNADAPPRRAVGIHVEIRPPEGLTEDDLFDDVAGALDEAEQALHDAGFSLAVQTGSTLLGVRALDADEPGSGSAAIRERAVAVSAGIHQAFTDRPGGDARVTMQVCVHEDSVLMGPSPQGERIAGGPLLCLGSWVSVEGSGVRVTPALLQAIEKDGGRPWSPGGEERPPQAPPSPRESSVRLRRTSSGVVLAGGADSWGARDVGAPACDETRAEPCSTRRPALRPAAGGPLPPPPPPARRAPP